MELLKGYWLVVVLAPGVSANLGPQPDCVQTAMTWMHEARAWRVRSQVEAEPMWFCVPPSMYPAVRMQSVAR